MRSENGRRLREDKRNRILKSAIKVFARKGFYNTKIAEIAYHAGVADGTIYLYFKNKDDILISLFDDSMEKIITDLQARLEGIASPAEKLRVFIRQHFELVRNTPDLAAVFQLELRQSNKFIKEYSGSHFNNYLNLIGSIIQEGQAAGLFRQDILPGIFKHALFGALDELSTAWVLNKNKNYNLTDSANQVAAFFLEGLLKTKA